MGNARGELYGLQMLRALAAFGVIVHHALEMSDGAPATRFSPDWLTLIGAAGVDVFFVVSGFIMVYVSFPPGRPPLRPRTFIEKRLTRIYPLYWVCLAAFFAALSVGLLKGQPVTATTVVNSLLLLPGEKLISLSWTLSYELYFYIIFSISLFLSSRSASIIGICSVLCGLVAFSRFTGSDFELLRFVGNPIVLEFCFGMILGYLALRGWTQGVPLGIGFVGFALIIASPSLVSYPDTNGLPQQTRIIAWGLPSALIVASFINLKRPATRFGRSCVLAGDASYALYLTHAFVMIAYGWLIKSTVVSALPQIGIVPIVIGVSIGVGLATHVVVEKPMLDVVRGARRRGRETGAGTAALPMPGSAFVLAAPDTGAAAQPTDTQRRHLGA